jgi:hypothetical protein
LGFFLFVFSEKIVDETGQLERIQPMNPQQKQKLDGLRQDLSDLTEAGTTFR